VGPEGRAEGGGLRPKKNKVTRGGVTRKRVATESGAGPEDVRTEKYSFVQTRIAKWGDQRLVGVEKKQEQECDVGTKKIALYRL